MSSSRLPLGSEQLPASEQQHYDARLTSLRQRREAAARLRRRRLVAIDLGIAAALALFGLIVAPGLAILALAALIALAGCGAWVVIERVLSRRQDRGRPSGGRRR